MARSLTTGVSMSLRGVGSRAVLGVLAALRTRIALARPWTPLRIPRKAAVPGRGCRRLGVSPCSTGLLDLEGLGGDSARSRKNAHSLQRMGRRPVASASAGEGDASRRWPCTGRLRADGNRMTESSERSPIYALAPILPLVDKCLPRIFSSKRAPSSKGVELPASELQLPFYFGS